LLVCAHDPVGLGAAIRFNNQVEGWLLPWQRER